MSWTDFIDGLDKLAGRAVTWYSAQQQDALQSQQMRYQQQAAQLAAQQQADQNQWIMPALLIGGGVLIFTLLRK